jgi:hypothetical protein
LLQKNPGGNCKGLAEIGSLIENAFEGINNPSLLAMRETSNLSIYQETPYFEKDLILVGLSFQRGHKNFPFGGYFLQQGNNYFKQQLLTASLAKKLNESVYLGVSSHFLLTQQYQVENKGNFLLELGGLFVVQKKIRISAVLNNINGSKIKIENPEHLSLQIKLGILYQFNSQISFLFEELKRSDENSISKLGLQYQLNPNFQLYFGWKSNPQQLSFGSSFKNKKTIITLTASHHRYLGLYPSVELQYQLNKLK